MFQHPALRKNTRSRAYGVLAAKQYYAIALPDGYNFGRSTQLVSRLQSAGVSFVDGTSLPQNSVLVVYAGANPALFDYTVYAINNAAVYFEVDGTDVQVNGMGSVPMSYDFEKVLEANAINANSFQTKQAAIDRAREMLAGDVSASAPAAETPAAASPQAPRANTPMKTGYYEGNYVGVAVYYNDAGKYIEWIAAPPQEGHKTQPRFKPGDKHYDAFVAMVNNAGGVTSTGEALWKGNDRAARKKVIATALSEKGEELREPGRGGGSSYTPSTASAPSTAPATTPASGTPAPSTGGKKGIPGWVWWTSGTVLVAGLGVWGAIMIKKNKAAAQ